MDNLPHAGGYRLETAANTAYAHGAAWRSAEREQSRHAMGPRPISLLAGQRPTKATIGSRPERVDGHIGTETRPRLLREAAVGDIAQWGEP